MRILFMAVLSYLALIVMLRNSGNRTLAHVSAVDFIFLAAIGSAFGQAITAQEVGIIDALVAFSALLTVVYRTFPGDALCAGGIGGGAARALPVPFAVASEVRRCQAPLFLPQP